MASTCWSQVSEYLYEKERMGMVCIRRCHDLSHKHHRQYSPELMTATMMLHRSTAKNVLVPALTAIIKEFGSPGLHLETVFSIKDKRYNRQLIELTEDFPDDTFLLCHLWVTY